jgi:hypothetical protein
VFGEILVLGLHFREQNLLYATPKLIAEATVKNSPATDTVAEFVSLEYT